MLLKNKTAIITGCNKGIGLATLKIFAQNGANIFACARNYSESFEEECNLLSAQNNVSIMPIYFDLSSSEELKEGVKQIVSKKSPIDILINNAGVIHTALFQMTSMDKFEELMNINFFSHMRLTQYISKIMVKQNSGVIVNVSSSAAIDCNVGRIAYTASKAAVISASKVLAKELGDYNIRVNAIAPGLTQTDMMENSTPKDILFSTLQQTSLKRVGETNEIANAILFLSSNMSSYLTGQVIRVDGGMYNG